MDVSYVIVAVIALAIGVVIGQRRKRNEPDSIFGNGQSRENKSVSDQDQKKGDMSAGMRLFMAIFLTGWLIAWSAGILMAFSMFTSAGGGATLFLGGWLIAAIAGWCWAVYTLWKLVMGQPVNLRRWN